MRKKKIADKRNERKKEGTIVQLWTIEQLAHRLNVGVRTVWRMDENQEIPAAYRVGHRKRWEPADIELWLKLGSPDRLKFNQLKSERTGNGKNEKGKKGKTVRRE